MGTRQLWDWETGQFGNWGTEGLGDLVAKGLTNRGTMGQGDWRIGDMKTNGLGDLGTGKRDLKIRGLGDWKTWILGV